MPEYEITNKRQAVLYTPAILAANRYCAEIPIQRDPPSRGEVVGRGEPWPMAWSGHAGIES